MIICISGLSGCGKNTVGDLVAKKLGFRTVNPTFKTLAKKEKISLMEFHRKAEKEHSIDRKFDDELRRQAARGNCVVTTWLGPWMIKDADLRIWLHATREERAKRVAGREGWSAEQALLHITERDSENHKRYMDVYKIDIYDHSGFDLVLNTGKLAPDESAEIIAKAALAIQSPRRLSLALRRKENKNKKVVLMGEGCCCCCGTVEKKAKKPASKKGKKK